MRCCSCSMTCAAAGSLRKGFVSDQRLHHLLVREVLPTAVSMLSVLISTPAHSSPFAHPPSLKPLLPRSPSFNRAPSKSKGIYRASDSLHLLALGVQGTPAGAAVWEAAAAGVSQLFHSAKTQVAAELPQDELEGNKSDDIFKSWDEYSDLAEDEPQSSGLGAKETAQAYGKANYEVLDLAVHMDRVLICA